MLKQWKYFVQKIVFLDNKWKLPLTPVAILMILNSTPQRDAHWSL